jgi:hypothetical protein
LALFSTLFGVDLPAGTMSLELGPSDIEDCRGAESNEKMGASEVNEADKPNSNEDDSDPDADKETGGDPGGEAVLKDATKGTDVPGAVVAPNVPRARRSQLVATKELPTKERPPKRSYTKPVPQIALATRNKRVEFTARENQQEKDESAGISGGLHFRLFVQSTSFDHDVFRSGTPLELIVVYLTFI